MHPAPNYAARSFGVKCVGLGFGPRSVRGRSEVDLGSMWGRFEVGLGSVWGQFEMTLV